MNPVTKFALSFSGVPPWQRTPLTDVGNVLPERDKVSGSCLYDADLMFDETFPHPAGRWGASARPQGQTA